MNLNIKDNYEKTHTHFGTQYEPLLDIILIKG